MSEAHEATEAHLLEVVDRVVGAARPSESVEAVALDQTDTSVRAYAGEVEALTSARSSGVGIRVIDRGRVGYAYTADTGETALIETLEEARVNATVATPDDANVLPVPDGPLRDDLDLYDAAFEAVTPQDKVERALALEAAVRGGDPRIKGVDSCRYGDSVTTSAIASTAGVRGATRRCDAYVAVEALASAEDGTTTSAFGLDVARLPTDLDVDMAAGEAVERAVRLLGGRKAASARLPVVLDPFAAASLLGVLAGALTAEAVQKGRSLFADKVGEELGGAHLTLVDDGRRTDAPAAAPWDDEGVPTQRTTLIEGGVLRGWLHNAYTAAKDGVRSTGNARRSWKSPPGVGPTNLWLEPGDASREELLARAGTAFYCQQIMGVHSGANPISGEISVGAAGLMVRDGSLAEPVREVTIAGTVPELLASLSAIGTDLRFLPFGGGMGGSTWLVDEMALSGS